MAETAFVVRVPEAEAHVGELRQRFDPSVRLGVPAHITVLFPFMSPERITELVFSEVALIFAEHAAFAFLLARIGRFPATAYLAPDPEERFIALTSALAARFPEYPPYGGIHASVTPHLTVADRDAAAAEAVERELRHILESRGPIQASCNSVALLENSSGKWRELHVFQLRQVRG